MKGVQTTTICEVDQRLYNVMVDRYRRKLVSVKQAVIILNDTITDREYFEAVGKNDFLRAVAKS